MIFLKIPFVDIFVPSVDKQYFKISNNVLNICKKTWPVIWGYFLGKK